MKFLNWINKIDPIRKLTKEIYNLFKKGGLKKDQDEYIRENLVKHRIVLWLTVFSGLTSLLVMVQGPERIPTLSGSAQTTAVFLGVAWFAMSLSSIPKEHGFIGILITFCVFTPFMMSYATYTIATVLMVGEPIAAAKEVLQFTLATTGFIFYDLADSLGSGYVASALKFYEDRGVRNYHHRAIKRTRKE